MCAAISPRLFKLNNQIRCDQAINNIEHEMFADGKALVCVEFFFLSFCGEQI